MIGGRKTTATRSWPLRTLLLITFMWAAALGTNKNANAAPENLANTAIHIVDQNGRDVPSGKRSIRGQTFEVTVGPLENEFSFMPDTIYIGIGDTVRWTWASDFHSVTSGENCFPDQRFCSPDNMHCEAGILNNTGFVYEFTFTQPGTYQYFCALHCLAGMTGVVNVMRSPPVPRPRPTPVPRPAL